MDARFLSYFKFEQQRKQVIELEDHNEFYFAINGTNLGTFLLFIQYLVKSLKYDLP